MGSGSNQVRLGHATHRTEDDVNDLFDEYLEDPADFQSTQESTEDLVHNQEALPRPGAQVPGNPGSNRVSLAHGARSSRDQALAWIDGSPQNLQ